MNRKCGGIHNGKAMSFNSPEEIDVRLYDFKILFAYYSNKIENVMTQEIFSKRAMRTVIPVI